jgi:hypothetical protein
MEDNGQRQSRGGNRKSKSPHPTLQLADLGITKDQSSLWQKLARQIFFSYAAFFCCGDFFVVALKLPIRTYREP